MLGKDSSIFVNAFFEDEIKFKHIWIRQKSYSLEKAKPRAKFEKN